MMHWCQRRPTRGTKQMCLTKTLTLQCAEPNADEHDVFNCSLNNMQRPETKECRANETPSVLATNLESPCSDSADAKVGRQSTRLYASQQVSLRMTTHFELNVAILRPIFEALSEIRMTKRPTQKDKLQKNFGYWMPVKPP